MARRCVAREHSVTAAGPFRISTGFPVCRRRQAVKRRPPTPSSENEVTLDAVEPSSVGAATAADEPAKSRGESPDQLLKEVIRFSGSLSKTKQAGRPGFEQPVGSWAQASIP